FETRVILKRAAVGAASGTATLTFPRETLNTGGAYLLPAGSAPLAGNLEQIVPLVALDSEPMKRPIRVIKMDVEGAEPLVIRRAERMLKEDRPLILSELHPTQLARASQSDAAAFLGQMRDLGYRAHLLEHGSVGAPIEQIPTDVLIAIALVPVDG